MFESIRPLTPSGRRVRNAWDARVLTLSMLGVIVLSACKPPDSKPAAPPAMPPQEVSVVEVAPATVPVEYEYIGKTEASMTVEIRARVTGFLLKRLFEEGKPIRAGDPLFEIDPKPFEADLEIARAKLAQAEAGERLAQLDVTRYTEATQKGAASRRELDAAETSLADARASVNLARAQVAKAELDLSYTHIASPVTGIIGRSLKDEGSYLDPSNSGLLAVATQTNPMYVTFAISERDWLQWRHDVESGTVKGDMNTSPVRVWTLDGKPYAHGGRINYFDTEVDPQTGAARARAELPNPDDQLKPGQFVRVKLQGWQRPNTITVPQRAVIQNPGGKFVMIVDADSKTQIRPVTLGAWLGDDWVVEGGLKAGDRVVVEGFAKAMPGTTVRAVPYHPAPDAGTTGPGSPTH